MLIVCGSSYQLLQQEVGSRDHLLWSFVHILSSSRGTRCDLSLPRKTQTPEEKGARERNSRSARHWLGPRACHLTVAREGHLHGALEATVCLLSFMFILPRVSPSLSYKVCVRSQELPEVSLVFGIQVSHLSRAWKCDSNYCPLSIIHDPGQSPSWG